MNVPVRRAAYAILIAMSIGCDATSDVNSASHENWRIVEDLRIGAADGDGPDVFGEIAAIGVSPLGLIHVIDGHAQEVRVFSPEGEHVRTFGGRGGGPGELENAYALDWDRAGNLWIVDPGNGRYAVYDSTGVLRFHQAREVPGVVFPWLGGIAVDGNLYDVAAVQPSEELTQYTFFRVDENGNVTGSLPPIEYRPTRPPAASMTLFWITPRVTFAFDAQGVLWFANTGEYRIIARSLAGDTLRIISREFTPEPVGSAERDSIRRELAAALPQDRDVSVPRTRPAIERLFPDGAGRLYVKRVGNRPGAPVSAFDAFDEDGRFLGVVASDVSFVTFPALPRFTDSAVYGVTADSLGVQYVVRARIVR